MIRALHGHRRRPDGTGDTEIDDPGAVVGQDNVGRLKVPVHQATRVNGGQSLSQRRGQVPYLRLAQRAALGNRRGQRRAVDIRRDHPGRVCVRIGIDDRSGVEPIDGARSGNLTSKARPERRIC